MPFNSNDWIWHMHNPCIPDFFFRFEMLARVSRSVVAATAKRMSFAPLPVSKLMMPVVIRPFSMTSFKASHGKVDKELAELLEKESTYEKESENEDANRADFIKDFKKNGKFEIFDKEGSKEVKLVRKFGNEKISVYCTTDSISEAEDVEDAPESEESTFPIRLTIFVQKENAGAIEFDATFEDGSLFIDHVAFGKDAQVLTGETVELDWNRRELYGGPVFGELDDGVQESFHEYLTERGLDAELAEFIASYLEHKEQKEYVNWLNSVSKFLSK